MSRSNNHGQIKPPMEMNKKELIDKIVELQLSMISGRDRIQELESAIRKHITSSNLSKSIYELEAVLDNKEEV